MRRSHLEFHKKMHTTICGNNNCKQKTKCGKFTLNSTCFEPKAMFRQHKEELKRFKIKISFFLLKF